jgi:transposase
MAAERLPVRKLREIIRLRLQVGLTGRAIARSCLISPGTVSEYLGRVGLAKLTWPLPPELDDDAALEALLFPAEKAPQRSRPEPDWALLHEELKRRHVTKLLLWQEYREAQPEGYGYSQFCDLYQRWARPLLATMRQVHHAGEKSFIDFSGDGIDVVDPFTGECKKAVLFVAVLGASSLTYAEPVLHQDLPTWIGCHVRAFDYFGGVTEVWVPDQPKVAVKRADRYDPELNPTYAELARHYGAAVIPARPRKPRDKAKVEAAVLLAERWVLAVLRHRTFYSLEELRSAVAELVEKLNNRPMRRLKKSRRQLFEEMERAALKPLPTRPYELALWERPTVAPDYHVEFEDNFYSVPYQLLGEKLELRATETTIEIFRRGSRITSHERSYGKGKYVTKNEHMPRGHRDYAEWTPQRIIAWAKSVGPQTAALVEAIMAARMHPEHGFKRCLGIMGLRRQYPDERIERAAARALRFRTLTYRSVAAILKNNLDREDLPGEERQQALPLHGNIRGSRYYH